MYFQIRALSLTPNSERTFLREIRAAYLCRNCRSICAETAYFMRITIYNQSMNKICAATVVNMRIKCEVNAYKHWYTRCGIICAENAYFMRILWTIIKMRIIIVRFFRKLNQKHRFIEYAKLNRRKCAYSAHAHRILIKTQFMQRYAQHLRSKCAICGLENFRWFLTLSDDWIIIRL